MPVAADIPASSGWGRISEDWCAVLLGLGVVLLAVVTFLSGSNLLWFAVVPSSWSSLHELAGQFRVDLPRYAGLGFLLLTIFSSAARLMGHPPTRFAASFVLVFCLSLLILTGTAWTSARQLFVETPVVALVLGFVLANTVGLPAWAETGMRAEFYIKLGVVLLGATLPLPVIRLAGPIALAQASVASIVTFLVIYNVARFLALDRRLAAMLAGGGSICGISAVIAIAGAVRARRDHITVATTVVVGWALVMIVLLPLLARAWYLPAGVGGAWIGTSEYADAAGFAAAQTFGAFARNGAIAGTPDQALWAYTLVKVVGRDMWIGVWAAVLSLISVTWWEAKETGRKADMTQIWTRFPKFILGFVTASVVVTWASQGHTIADFDAMTRPGLIAPIDTIRNWVFTFSFLSIGASLKVRVLGPVTRDALIAFSVGVVVNLVLGFVLSAVVFASYWGSIAR